MQKRRAKLGDWLIECEVSGRTLYASEAKLRWDGKWVHPDYYEERHPMDLYRPDMSEKPPAFTNPAGVDTYSVDPDTEWADTSVGDPITTGDNHGDL